MMVGIPKEIKEEENRVALTPSGVSAFVAHGHQVMIERGAGRQRIKEGLKRELCPQAGPQHLFWLHHPPWGGFGFYPALHLARRAVGELNQATGDSYPHAPEP